VYRVVLQRLIKYALKAVECVELYFKSIVSVLGSNTTRRRRIRNKTKWKKSLLTKISIDRKRSGIREAVKSAGSFGSGKVRLFESMGITSGAF
jgi:hypothetical protein